MLRPHYFSRYFTILVPSSLNLCSIFTKVPVFKFRISIRACSYLKVRQSNTPVVVPTKIFLEESLVAPFTEGSKQHFYPKRVLCGLCSVTDFIVIYRIRKNSILLNLNGTKRSRNAIYFPSKQLGASKGPLGSFLTLHIQKALWISGVKLNCKSTLREGVWIFSGTTQCMKSWLTQGSSAGRVTLLLGTSFLHLYYYMKNYFNLIGLEQWYFSLI